uniref:Uncharacterized protein n=1 Tax=Anopheles maculatus TaxID=74869 RepID=A0A182S8F7_9DIPT
MLAPMVLLLLLPPTLLIRLTIRIRIARFRGRTRFFRRRERKHTKERFLPVALFMRFQFSGAKPARPISGLPVEPLPVALDIPPAGVAGLSASDSSFIVGGGDEVADRDPPVATAAAAAAILAIATAGSIPSLKCTFR